MFAQEPHNVGNIFLPYLLSCVPKSWDEVVVMVFWPKIVLPKVLCGKAHCHYAKFTCPVNDLNFIDECSAVIFQTSKVEFVADMRCFS